MALTLSVQVTNVPAYAASRPASLIGSDGKAHGHYLVESEALALADMWNGHPDLPSLMARLATQQAENIRLTNALIAIRDMGLGPLAVGNCRTIAREALSEEPVTARTNLGCAMEGDTPDEYPEDTEGECV